MKRAALDFASQGVFLGTSSWKYPGWRGQLYDDAAISGVAAFPSRA